MRRGHSTFGLATSVAVVAAGLVGGAAGSAAAAPFDPTTVCASATPTFDQLNTALTPIFTAGRDATVGGIQQTASISSTDPYSSGTFNQTFVYDATAQRARLDTTASGTGMGTAETAVADVATNSEYEFYQHSAPTWSGARQVNAGLLTLGLPDVWVTLPHTQEYTPDFVRSGFGRGGGIADLAPLVITPTFGTTFTCTVSGQVVSIAASGTDGTSTFSLTLSPTGLATHLEFSLQATGMSLTGQEDDVYAPQTVAPLAPSITAAAWNVAVDRALVRIVRAAVVKQARPKVVAVKTIVKRTAAVRAAAASRAAAFLKAYDTYGEVTAKRKNITHGVKVAIAYIDPTSGITTSGWFTVVVNGTHLVVTTHLP